MNHIAPTRLLTISLNGAPHGLPAHATIGDLLHDLGLSATKIAVERNEEIVPRSQYGNTALSQGDQIEIVHFIGGG